MKPSRAGFVAAVVLSIATVAPGQEPAVPMQEIEQVIRESEYHVSWQDQTVLPDLNAAWHATNRAQNLRFYFTVDGLRVLDRTAEDPAELLLLKMAIEGEDGSQPSIFEADDNVLTILNSRVTERFANTSRGLEHVMSISRPSTRDQPAEIELDWSAAGVEVRSGAVEFDTAAGRRLTYTVGRAFDAAGTEVEVDLRLRKNRIVMTLNGIGLIFPVTIKNLISGSVDTLLEGNLAGMGFGYRVAVGDLNGDGFDDVAAAVSGWDGGQTDEGAVLIFYGGPGGIVSNGSGSISTAADTIIESNVEYFSWPTFLVVVGDVNGDGYGDLAAGDCSWDPVNPPVSSQYWGAVWVFHGSASGVTATDLSGADAMIASDLQGASFGCSVEAAGDVNGDGYSDLVASAPMWSDDPTQVREGGVFVFHGSAAGFTATVSSQADTVLEGNVANLGARGTGVGDLNGDGFDDVAAQLVNLSHPESFEGGVAVFYGGATGIVSNTTQAVADAAGSLIEGNEAGVSFGMAARAGDINGDGFGDLITASRSWGDSPAHADEGVVAIYHGGPSGVASNPTGSFITKANTIIEGNPSPHVRLDFGAVVMPAGDCNGDGFADVAVSTEWFENGESNEGALFIFHGAADGIPNSRVEPVEDVADTVLEGNLVDLYFGWTGSVSGDVNSDGFSDLVVPVTHYSVGDYFEGAVFIYHGGADVLAQEADAQHDFSVADAGFGSPASNAGDLNGDGFSDVAVGAPFHDVLSYREGSVHVFFGSTDPSLSSPDWSFDGQYLDGWTGVGVESAGDLNGDGFGDLAVGTPNASNTEIEEGRVDVFYGSAGGLSSSPDWSYEADLDYSRFGMAVSTAGDIDGDGYGDLIVGAPYYSNGESYEGRAYVFFGSSMGLPLNPGWTYESDVAFADLGFAVASAGDVNGDGFGDVIIGAYGYTSGESDEGAAYGFYGSENGLPAVPNWFIQTNRVDAYYGLSVAGVGDVNGDGFSDVIVGAPYDTNGETNEGRAYVYHGSTSGLSTIANQVLEENVVGASFGVDVAAAGDVNGDGFSDVTVGSPFTAVPGSLGGRASLYLGTAAGMGNDPGWLIAVTGANDLLGHSAAGAGDVNGDGFSDVVIGIPLSDAGAADGGSIELYLGNAGAGRPVLARQFRGAGDPTPVQPWGLTHSGDSFQVSMTATSPRGRELAKIHVEACPPGEVWGDVECRHVVSTYWTAIPLGEDGVTIVETLSGLTEGELYRWRAHVLFLPLHADAPGITEPPVPRHGPWRTLFAQAPAADIRVGEPQQITIELVASSSSVGEGAPQAEVTVVMTTSDGAPSEIDSSVDFATWDGSAFAGHDYVHNSFNRFFPGGTASGTAGIITVDFINDDLDEPDEDFAVEIYNPMGAVLGPQTTHTVTILDDDPPPELSATDVLIDEGAGLAVVVLELSARTSFEATVDYATADGSAVAPEDYVPVSGTAFIPPMDTIFNIEIPIEDDWLEEGNESFTLDLSSPANAVIVSPTVTITIMDDDAGIIFADGFESGDFSAWSSIHP